MARSLEAVPIDKLESYLRCSICLETLKDPRTLPCFHSYCKSCLEKEVKTRRKKAPVGRQIKEFHCPECRSQFTLNPGDEVSDMIPNHFICNMLELMAVPDRVKGVPCPHCPQRPSVGRCVTCEVFLCQKCLTDHNNYRGFSNHSVLSMDELSKPENQAKIRGKSYCKQHTNKSLKFYCETCQELICRYCTDLTHEKPHHSWLPIEIVANKQKQVLASTCNKLNNQFEESNKLLATISNDTQSLDRTAKNVKSEIKQKKQEILNTFTQILDKKAQHLLDEVSKIHIEKRTKLLKQTEVVRGHANNVKLAVRISTKLLQQGSNERILSSQKVVQEVVENLNERCTRNMKPANNTNIHYEPGRVDEKKIAEIADCLGSTGSTLKKLRIKLKIPKEDNGMDCDAPMSEPEFEREIEPELELESEPDSDSESELASESEPESESAPGFGFATESESD